MALLDFMKQGTQWLTDNTGMDWNTVQRDPGMAAQRLMGAPVDLNSQYQAQPTQDNLLGTPNEIVASPEMQNRQTFIPDAQQIKPDMGVVNQYNDFNYEATDPELSRYYNKAASDVARQNGIRLSEGGYEELEAKQGFVNGLNEPMYDSALMGKAQDMSLQNTPSKTVDANTINPYLNYENTTYEANKELEELTPIIYKNTTPEDSVASKAKAKPARIELNKNKVYTAQRIMESGKSDAEIAALLEKYGIDPSTYIIPGLITGK